ncbi:hypothetical protein GN958_ATG20942 [Phytophthora infestans]|uniref:Uncharacterized protein n=1 Tax=Phytophthora infestans TaxID=4787 RepID=A0A8S9TLM9_PHYIN|nr:hypothetical protein GN958_ATG20942 [Phytophthora infestans]
MSVANRVSKSSVTSSVVFVARGAASTRGDQGTLKLEGTLTCWKIARRADTEENEQGV